MRYSRVPVVCNRCGRDFLVKAYRKDTAQFCSSACHYAAASVPLPDRFWPRVRKTDGCWLWTGYCSPEGYGEITLPRQRRHIGAHVASWIIHVGPVPPGMWVLHRCDNPPCVRPDHLELGPPRKNANDMAARGRAARGEGNAKHRLTPELVRDIRASVAAGETLSSVCRRLDVGRSTVGHVVSGRTWTHVV